MTEKIRIYYLQLEAIYSIKNCCPGKPTLSVFMGPAKIIPITIAGPGYCLGWILVCHQTSRMVCGN